jgi:predicted PurR-regulated permease PerM
MTTNNQALNNKEYQHRVFEIAVRLGLVGILIIWCYRIASPFITTILWGIIIAVALRSSHVRLKKKLGGRNGLAAVVITLLLLLILIVPTIILSGTLVDSAQEITTRIKDGTLHVPPPSARVKTWPVIGDSLHKSWSLASTNLGAALNKMAPQLKAFGGLLLSSAAGAGTWVLQFVIAIIIAGAFLTNAAGGHYVAHAIAARVADERGPELVELAQNTVQSVARGILGVAIIQSILAGLGMYVVGVPGAGLWTLLVLLLAVIQLPPILVLLPVIIYVFSTTSTFAAVVFTIWSVFAGSCDTFLKPILLGRGAQVPMFIIFIGAIGGFMTSGIIGLFVGAIVFSLGYRIFMAWLKEEAEPIPDENQIEASAAEGAVEMGQ